MVWSSAITILNGFFIDASLRFPSPTWENLHDRRSEYGVLALFTTLTPPRKVVAF
jgi:hypothetical protein